MHLITSGYKHQYVAIRHYELFAQVFYTAFGKDTLGTIWNDTTISQADFDGVNLTAIHALIKRMEQQRLLNEQWRKEVETLREELWRNQKSKLKSQKSKSEPAEASIF